MSDGQIEAIRRFNRFHTRLVGALNEHVLASGYSLPQMRVLYEIASAPRNAPLSASELGALLRIDTGYLSRVLAGLESQGLIARKPSAANAKRLELQATDRGQQVFGRANAAAAEEVAALIAPLSARDRDELVGAMARIRRLLGDLPADQTFILRDPEPGDIGWIIHRQGRLYAEEYGFDWSFEALLAEITARFINSYDRSCERCWVAEREGEVVGSVFVVKHDDTTAKLRLLYVEPSARGCGLGRRLVNECLRFARLKGYARIVLWTNDILVSARRIYETTGFRLIEEEPHHSFGKDLIGQTWELTL